MPQTPNDAEVQNVLSSIRRLIDENRPAPGAALAPLVLAPSLRVDAPGEPAPAAEPLILRSPVIPPAAGLAPDAPVALDPAPDGPEPVPALDASGAEAALNAPAAEPTSEPPAALDPLPPSDEMDRPVMAPGPDAPSDLNPAASDVMESAPLPPNDLLVSFSEPSEAPEVPPEPQPTSAATSALPIDERALRALIADVVREELQGELGERMTRNLRKLVRREILQALAATREDP